MFKCFVGIAKSSRQVEVALDDLQKNGFIAADISVFMPNSGETPELGPVKGTKMIGHFAGVQSFYRRLLAHAGALFPRRKSY
jgi:hypothetical protein